jgi:hypothetical protein
MKVGAITLMTVLLFAWPALAGTDPCTGPDWDGDGTVDACDNCSDVYNQEQYDGDQDGYGDACDGDYAASTNGVCDGADFGNFAKVFTTFVPPTSCEYDHSVNGAVDGADFGAFATLFMNQSGPSCQAAPGGPRGIPCPTPGAVCP